MAKPNAFLTFKTRKEAEEALDSLAEQIADFQVKFTDDKDGPQGDRDMWIRDTLEQHEIVEIEAGSYSIALKV